MMSSCEEEEELYVNMSQMQEEAAATASDTETGAQTKAGYLYKQGIKF